MLPKLNNYTRAYKTDSLIKEYPIWHFKKKLTSDAKKALYSKYH